MKIITTPFGYCYRWGAEMGARHVHGLSKDERIMIKSGEAIIVLTGCPEYQGISWRYIVHRNGHFYTRMPTPEIQAAFYKRG